MLPSAKLTALVQKYGSHPQFLGTEITEANQRGALDDTMLHIAAWRGAIEDIEALIFLGADVNAVGDLGNTPLHEAAMSGQLGAAKKLLELGADASLKNEFEQTALEVAELSGRVEIIKALRGLL